MTQVGGNYAEHRHQYVRGWEHLHGVSVDEREMEIVQHAFVDTSVDGRPGRVAEAVGALRRFDQRRSVLVLLGEAGAGRRTAALRVLHGMGVPRERIRWLVPDWEQPRIEQIPATEKHGFILDLTDHGSLPESFYSGLSGYQKEAGEKEAVLVILATPEAWDPGHLASIPHVRLVRPAAAEVARAHLRCLAPDRVDWLSGTPLEELLAAATHAFDAARLAQLVADSESDDRDTIKEEFTGWKKHLQGWFEKRSSAEDLRERALLVAAALLEDVPASVVMEAADQLFKEVGGVLPPGGALAGRDLYQRLDTIEASQIGENISLEAKRHGLPGAVLTHVWQQRPQLRQALLEWASKISAPNGVAEQHLQCIAESLVRLSLLPDGATVRSVVSDWLDKGHARHRRLAVEILESMALHPATGAGVRKQLYDWAHQKNTSEARAAAVAEICAGRLGLKYPRVALTRLRLLASRSDGKAREAVASAVRTLAGRPEQRVLVLSEIIDWSSSADGTVRQAGASIFLALTDITDEDLLPLLVVGETPDDSASALGRQLFVRGWRAALLEPDVAEAALTSLAAWLDSSMLPDDTVLPVVAAVIRGHLGQQGVARLLVGSSDSTGLGRARRHKLVDQLIDTQSAPPSGLGAGREPAGEETRSAA
ncbi:hypothetical protein [Streptomyces carminius]|uniref:hypothetical protein n=1 Tax=Streptomyces carminius TaxID=2665496 RepID=UPI001E5E2024|nr:hypothetical protein [Streptomyces carminius]